VRITRERSVAVLVDIQQRLFPHMQNRDQLERSCVKLIRGLKILGIPIIQTQQYTRGLGATIPSIEEALREKATDVPEDRLVTGPLEKTAFSCMGCAPFKDALEQRRREIVLLLGIEAHVCVLQTALDLGEAGYLPVVVEDCTSSRFENDGRIALMRMGQEGIRLTTVESVLFELTRDAGAKEFKTISALVKETGA